MTSIWEKLAPTAFESSVTNYRVATDLSTKVGVLNTADLDDVPAGLIDDAYMVLQVPFLSVEKNLHLIS